MGSTLGAISFVQIIAPELNDRMLSDLLNLDSALTVTFHIRSLNQAEAIKAVKRKLTDIEKGKIEEQKKAVRSGYDMGATRSLTTTNIVGNKAYTKLNLYIELIF